MHSLIATSWMDSTPSLFSREMMCRMVEKKRKKAYSKFQTKFKKHLDVAIVVE